MKLKQNLQILFILLLIAASCSSLQESDNSKKIIGKWKGTHVLYCAPHHLVDGHKIEYEFNADYKAISKYYYGTDPTPSIHTRTYKIEGDTLSWGILKNNMALAKQHIQFLNDNTLMFCSMNNLCWDTTLLQKVTK